MFPEYFPYYRAPSPPVPLLLSSSIFYCFLPMLSIYGCSVILQQRNENRQYLLKEQFSHCVLWTCFRGSFRVI